jgi:hypothetical protein
LVELISLLLEGAVAAGTLLLAIVAYYEARLLVRERKFNQGRELLRRSTFLCETKFFRGWSQTTLDSQLGRR